MAKRAPKMYRELAGWFHLITAPADYRKEANFYRKLLVDSCDRRPRTVLELGSGGGNNASHLKRYFQMTLVDLSRDMLNLSRRLNPECEHVQGDMRMVRLRREFDAVFVHDAVMYLTTERDLARAMKTAFVHCQRGGVALFVPDWVRETFRPKTGHGGHDAPDGRAARYLNWDRAPSSGDTSFLSDYAYLLRERNGSVRMAYDRHVCGLFPRRTWLRLLRETGFRASVVRPPKTQESGEYPGEVFVCRRPA